MPALALGCGAYKGTTLLSEAPMIKGMLDALKVSYWVAGLIILESIGQEE